MLKKILIKTISKKEVLLTCITIILAACCVLVMVWFAKHQNMEFSELSRDVVSVLKGKPFTGLLSKIGIIEWGVSAVTLLCGAFYCYIHVSDRKCFKISLSFGLLSTLLYLDDYLLIHEIIVKYYLKLPEASMMVLYGVLVIVFCIMFFNDLSRNGLLMIVISFGFLGISAGFDMLEKFIHIPNIHVFEDGAKFIGSSLWMLFAISYTLRKMSIITSQNTVERSSLNHEKI